MRRLAPPLAWERMEVGPELRWRCPGWETRGARRARAQRIHCCVPEPRTVPGTEMTLSKQPPDARY